MKVVRRRVAAGLVAASTLAGGAVGATVFSAGSSSAAGTSTTAAPGSTQPAPYGGPPAGGRFVPNEDPTHEKGESAQREAQETAGKFPTVP